MISGTEINAIFQNAQAVDRARARSVLYILNKPHLLKFKFAVEQERRAIRLRLTLALIEDILAYRN